MVCCIVIARSQHGTLGGGAELEMIQFPVFSKFLVRNYGLFPDCDGREGLTISFQHGPNLIAGINGLGKTTVVMMMLRALTGPFDLSRRGGSDQLGEIKTEAVRLANKSLFKSRVADGAESAFVELSFSIGGENLVVRRQLNNLSLSKFVVSGIEIAGADEDKYQEVIAGLIGVSSFFDVILILRHLVFYMEDRRELVWDPTAQRELFRILFLDPESATRWAELHAEIKSKDSSARNLNTIINRSKDELWAAQSKLANVSKVRAKIRTHQALQDVEIEDRGSLEDAFEKAGSEREDARERLLRAEMQADENLREMERLKMRAVAGYFPGSEETAKFLFTHLIAGNNCISCGALEPEIVQTYQNRIKSGDCLICGSHATPL